MLVFGTRLGYGKNLMVWQYSTSRRNKNIYPDIPHRLSL